MAASVNTPPEQQTVRSAIAFGRAYLPPGETLVLLGAVLEVDRPALLAHGDRRLSSHTWQRFEDLVQRAASGEPLPYLLGEAPFAGHQFTVNQAVLIPRPETELLLEKTLSVFSDWRHRIVVDVGTGSGCLGISFLATFDDPGRLPYLVALDISGEALKVARHNASRLLPAETLNHLSFCQADLLAPLRGKIDLIVANLPYIADSEWTDLSSGVRHFEPALALRGGPDGLRLIERLLLEAHDRLVPGGIILLEIGWQQGRAAAGLARKIFPGSSITCLKDWDARDRIIEVRLQ